MIEVASRLKLHLTHGVFSLLMGKGALRPITRMRMETAAPAYATPALLLELCNELSRGFGIN